jgi:hypothetical protein
MINDQLNVFFFFTQNEQMGKKITHGFNFYKFNISIYNYEKTIKIKHSKALLSDYSFYTMYRTYSKQVPVIHL